MNKIKLNQMTVSGGGAKLDRNRVVGDGKSAGPFKSSRGQKILGPQPHGLYNSCTYMYFTRQILVSSEAGNLARRSLLQLMFLAQ